MTEPDCSPDALAEMAKRASHHNAVYYANVVRAAEKLTYLAQELKANTHRTRPLPDMVEWAELECFEALECAFDLDLSDHLDDLRQELGIDAEGFQTNDEGDSTDYRIHTPLTDCKV